MDRIREAISRARGANKETAAPARQAAAPAPHSAIVRKTDPEFADIICDADIYRRHRIVANEHDPVRTAYRVLRTRVLQKMEANGWKTLAVVSAGSGAGKTVTAINLAIAIGSTPESRATLVDLDFYRPSIARYLGIRDYPSLLDFFEGRRDLDDVTLRTNFPNLLLLANERVSRRGAEFLTSDNATTLIQKTAGEYGSRIVVFDLPPLLGCDDTIAFLPQVDCVLLIAASGQTRVPELKEAKRLLKDVNIVGTVLNKTPASLVQSHYY